MTLQQTLSWATQKLGKTKITSPSLDSEVLLSFVIKKPKEYLYTYPEKELTKKQWNEFKKLIGRRAKHEPVAYLVKRKEFFGLNFYVDKNVLIPRPETEQLIEEILKMHSVSSGHSRPVSRYGVNSSGNPHKGVLDSRFRGNDIKEGGNDIVDVGTGSGCIAITLAKHLPKARIYATDISSKTLQIARKNAKLNGIKKQITFLHGNLLEPLFRKKLLMVNGQLLIVANLPYLTTKQWQQTSPDIKLFEPRQALDAGSDGLKYFRQLFKQIQLLITPQNPRLRGPRGRLITLILEIDPRQIKPLTELIEQSGLSRFTPLKPAPNLFRG